MNRIIPFLLLFSFLQADHISDTAQSLGYQTSFSMALEKAQSENKLLMMVIVTNYCPWCRKFESTTLKNPSIVKTITKDFIPLLINKDSPLYPQGYKVPGVPSVFFIDPSSKITLWRSFGYKTSSEFSKVLHIAKERSASSL